jgi:hypothetical protein
MQRFKNRSKERGSVTLVAAVSMVGLIGFTGMAIDVGYLQWSQVRIQDAADSAAQAALIELENGNTDWKVAGQNSAAMNGFTNGANGVTVSINNPPTTGSMKGNTSALEAIVTQATPTFFMQMLNTRSVAIQGYAAGSYASSSGSSGTGTGSGSSAGCVYVLDTASSDSQTMNVQGSSPTFNCGVVVESPNSQAVYLSGALTVNMGSGYTLGVVGPSTCAAAQPATQANCGIDYTSNQDYICTSGNPNCSASSEPTANGISNPGDPLTNISVPAFGTTFSAKNYYDMNSAPAGNTLQPGIYCGGLNIGNTNGATYTLNAGTYIIAGGTLQFNSQGTVKGSGVTFYLTSPADVASTTGSSCPSSLVTPGSTTIAKVNINGQPNVTLSAPATGASTGITGILLFENRSATTDNAPQIVGNSTTSLNGALYFKNSTLTFSGVNGSNTGYMMIVVKKLNINGSSPIVVYNVNNPISSNTVITGTAAVLGQ